MRVTQFRACEKNHPISDTPIHFESQRLRMPYLSIMQTIVNVEVLVLTSVRAHSEKNFPLFVKGLEAIVEYLFAFDHYNYC